MEAWDEVRSTSGRFGGMEIGGSARCWAIKTSGGELLGLEQYEEVPRGRARGRARGINKG